MAVPQHLNFSPALEDWKEIVTICVGMIIGNIRAVVGGLLAFPDECTQLTGSADLYNCSHILPLCMV